MYLCTRHKGDPARNRKRKRARDSPSPESGLRVSKSRKTKTPVPEDSSRSTTTGETPGPSGLSYFDPASLVKAKEGTFKAPKTMQRYLGKHLKRCLSKEEREALFKEHPRPDVDACVPPKVDKYLFDFLGKRFPKQQDTDLTKIQSAVLASVRPVISAWQGLIEGGIDEDPEMSVPAVEVLSLCQRTICLVGNASELISQERRSKVLEAIDTTWSKYGAKQYPEAGKMLFGEGFKATLTEKVEKDTALAKAVAITRKGKRITESATSSSFTRKDRQRNIQFFPRGPPAAYGSRQGKMQYHTQPSHCRPRELPNGKAFHPSLQRSQHIPNTPRFGQRPQFHEPRLPTDQLQTQRTQPRRP